MGFGFEGMTERMSLSLLLSGGIGLSANERLNIEAICL